MLLQRISLFAAATLFIAAGFLSAGDLSHNKIFKSDALGYDLHYRVYTPTGYETLSNLPILFATDGQWYIQNGKVHKEMDRLVAKGLIDPAIVVFIDNRDHTTHPITDATVNFFAISRISTSCLTNWCHTRTGSIRRPASEKIG